MRYDTFTVALAMVSKRGVYVSQRINTENFKGKWQFAGGKVEENENPIDAAAREAKEETVLEIPVSRLRYVGPIVGDPSTYICYVYYVELNGTEIPKKMEPDKTGEWEWYSFDDVLKLDTLPGIPMAIEKLKGKKSL